MILAKCALGAGSGEDYAYGARDDLQIHPETPILDIGHIQRGIIAVQNRLTALFLLDPECETVCLHQNSRGRSFRASSYTPFMANTAVCSRMARSMKKFRLRM